MHLVWYVYVLSLTEATYLRALQLQRSWGDTSAKKELSGLLDTRANVELFGNKLYA
jgi:hypothetical protein